MDLAPKTVFYKRSHFVTHLPVAYRYSPSHYWIGEVEPGLFRVGLTRFATRMLGEMVDHGFELKPQDPIKPGQIIGFLEGFKAISDIYSIASGAFAGTNPALVEKISLVGEDCYGDGWLYMVKGNSDPNCVDVEGYRSILDRTIDKILEKQKGNEIQ